MKTKTQKMLPKTAADITNGGVYSQRVRCGKASCKCSRGEHHTAFYYFTRQGGKLVKFYVRRSEVEAFSEIVEQSAVERRLNRQTVKAFTELLSRFRADLREGDGLIKALKNS